MYAYAGDRRTTATPLTAQAVDRLRGDGTDRWVKDGQVRCLYLRIRPNGEKTFALRVKREGKVAVITLGAWGPHPPQLSLKGARLEAARRLGSPAAKSRMSVEDALKEFWEGHIEREWKDQRNATVYRRVIEAALGRRVLAEVTKADVAGMVRRYRIDKDGDTRLVAANRLLSFTKLFLGWCAEAGMIEASPAIALTTRIAGGDEQSRERTLSDDEIRALWAWNGPHTPLLRALLLSGCRISELRNATAKDVVDDRLTIPAAHAKNGRAHWVHVTPTLRAQFTGRPPMLFHYASATAVQACVRRWQGFGAAAWTPHDLRRTFATIAAKLGTPPHIIRGLINHVEDGSLPIYQRHDYADERIAATKAIEAHVLGIVA
jgi:integrase